MKKAIVTGASSFIAKWVIRELRRHNVFVFAVKREGSAIEEWMFEDEHVVLINCEMKDYGHLHKIIDEDIDWVFHFAWQGNSVMGISTDQVVQLQNVEYSLRLIEAANRLHTKKFLCAGSIHEAEIVKDLVNGESLSNANNYYKSAKLAFHTMGKTYAKELKIKFFQPILFNTYGEGDYSNRLINYVITSILKGESPKLSSGNQMYDLLHVSDVARAFYLIAQKGRNDTEYTVCSGKVKPLKEYMLSVEKIVNEGNLHYIHLDFGITPDSNSPNVPSKISENPLLNEHTGFVPNVSFEDGIRRTLDWIKQKNNKVFFKVK